MTRVPSIPSLVSVPFIGRGESSTPIIENQTFTAGQTFIGPEWDGLVIRNCDFENISFPDERGAALLFHGVNDVTVEGCTFTNIVNGDGIRLGISLSSSDVTIQGCVLDGIDGDGIASGQRYDNGIDNPGLVIRNCTISDTGRVEPGGLLHGIYVQSTDYLIEGNTITQSNDGNGISVRSWGTVRDNTIHHSDGSGIAYYADHMGAGGTLVIDGNRVSGSGYGSGRNDIDLLSVPVPANVVAAIEVTNNQMEFGASGSQVGSGYSGVTITATNNTHLPGYPRAPDAPVNLRVTFQNANSIRVDWDAPVSWGGSALTGFTAEARPVGGSATSANITTLFREYAGLPSDTQFEIRVRARSALGDSPFTDWLSASTLA